MATIQTRKLGGVDVFPIGYGAMGLSAFYGAPLPDEERFKVLDAVFASGCNYWDTADAYLDSEDLLGAWLRKNPGKREKIFLATKFGFRPSAEGSVSEQIDGSAEYAESAIASSLKRLGVDFVDLYYLHRPDAKTPIEVTVGAMAKFVKEGKIKNIGLSECSASTLRRAHAVHPIAAVQLEYSPFTLDIEDPALNVLNTARELGIAIVAYSPLGRGLLTGKIKSHDDFDPTDFRRFTPRYSESNFPNILALSDGLKAIGAKHDATAGQVALAWLLGQGDDVIPIPGTTKIKSLEENLGAAKLKLTPEELVEVRKVAEKADAMNGARYPENFPDFFAVETPPLK